MVIKIGVWADTYAFKFEQSTSLRRYVCLFVRACVRLSICLFVLKNQIFNAIILRNLTSHVENRLL